MRVHVLQHVQFEGLGSIEPWLMERGARISYTRFFAQDPLPEPRTCDLLVIMGGPMSVNDEDRFPWLRTERQVVRDAITTGTSVLGICLGAQLIASSLGARVYPNRHKEIGWFPVHGITPPDVSVFSFPPSLDVFHWHGETFELPPGAVRLAYSEGCENQAFQIGNSVIGLQFHLETTPQSAEDIIANCRDELLPSRYVQTEKEMLSATPEQYQSINQVMRGILSYIRRESG